MKRACAVLIGTVFFVAGMLKLVDPVGAGLVVEEYFKFFHVGFLSPASKALGVALALLESLLGAALIAGVWRKTVAIITSAFIAFFTIITAILAIANPAMDCGCFGEAIHLTHAQTLLKNVVLCALAAIAFLPMRSLDRPKPRKYVTFGIAAAMVVAFAVRGLMGIPLTDFTEIAPGASLDGDVPLLSISDSEGDYCDGLLLEGTYMVASVHSPAKLTGQDWTALLQGIRDAEDEGYMTAILTASTPEDLEATLAAAEGLEMMDAMDILDASYFADRRKLLTLNRSNGGDVLIHNGLVIRKWAFRDTPSSDDLVALSSKHPLEEMVDNSSRGRMLMQLSLIVPLAILLLI